MSLTKAQQDAMNAAIPPAQACELKTGLWSSLTIAQWAVESNWGAACPGNNPFGITWAPKSIYGRQMLWTHEEIKKADYVVWKNMHPEIQVVNTLPSGNLRIKVQRGFNKYDSLEQAFEAHGRLLTKGLPYAAVWSEHCQDSTPMAFIDAMAPIYATDHAYADTLKTVIEAHALLCYDHPPQAQEAPVPFSSQLAGAPSSGNAPRVADV